MKDISDIIRHSDIHLTQNIYQQRFAETPKPYLLINSLNFRSSSDSSISSCAHARGSGRASSCYGPPSRLITRIGLQTELLTKSEEI